MTLSYDFTVINLAEGFHSTATSVVDPALASYGFSFEPMTPFTLQVGETATDTFEITLEDMDDCLDLAAADGVADDRFTNTLHVGWHSGSAQCSATVVCVPPPPMEGAATRTPGFFKTHEDAIEACLSEGPVELGSLTIDSKEDALGLLWGSPAMFDSKQKRSSLEKSRFLLARHTLVGTCNTRLFDTEPSPSDLISEAVEALGGTDCSLMRELSDQVDDYNNSGTEEAFPEGFEAGAASPRHAHEIAEDPTEPTAEQCSH